MARSSCVILAGGKGERLYPITQTRPKPLCPVGRTSCLGRCIVSAKKAGIKDISVTAFYLADEIEKEAKKYGDIKVVRETTPLGTAGCVKQCFPSGKNVLVLSGDCVNEFDLRGLLAFHEKMRLSGCVCTIAVTITPYPTNYGVVTVKDSLITRFSEKPSWENVTSDIINAGIYVLTDEALGEIPREGFFDFSNDLFPRLMAAGRKIAAWQTADYWCDIGNPKALYDCAMRYSNGRSSIHPSSKIHESAVVTSSIIMENASVGKGTRINSSIICEDVIIKENVNIPEGCVVGGGAVIGQGAEFARGVSVASGVLVGKGGKIMKDVRFGGVKGRLFDGDEGISGVYGHTFDPADGLVLGRSLCEAAEKPAGEAARIKIGVMYSDTPHSKLFGDALSDGVRYGGGVCYYLGEGFLSLCGYCAKTFCLNFSVFVDVGADFSLSVQIFDQNWRQVKGRAALKIESAFYRGGGKVYTPRPMFIPGEFEKPLYLYASSLLALSEGGYKKPFAVDASNPPGNVLYSVLKKLGCDVLNEMSSYPRLIVSSDGRQLSAMTREGEELGFWQLLCFYLGFVAEKKKLIYVPDDLPFSITRFLESKSAECRRCGDKADAGKDFDPCFRDGCFLGVSVIDALKRENLDFSDIPKHIPSFHIRTVFGEYEEREKARKVKLLCEECGFDDGARFNFENGLVRLLPSSPKGFKIISEAASSEYADELCDFGLKKLKD
ncbi:MAG: sugar phosphate nucleotidyltransferase [Eubacteriales bacterium]